MEEKDKILTRLRLAASLRKIIARNKDTTNRNKEKGKNDALIVDGIRQLEASSGLSYTIVQGVYSAKRDLQFTSLLSILGDGLGITLSEFAKIYDAITEEEIKAVQNEITESRRSKRN